MRHVVVPMLVLLLVCSASTFVACGGGGGGGSPPQGQPTLLSVPVKWFDTTMDGAINPGDSLRFSFTTNVDPGANLPQADLFVLNGNIGGASTWVDDASSSLSMVLGAAATINPGLLGGHTQLNVSGANTLVNPADGSTPALPSVTNQSVMANVSDSGQSFGSTLARDAYLLNLNNQIAPDIALALSGQNRLSFNDGTGLFTNGGNWVGDTGRQTYALAFIDEPGGNPVDYIVCGNGGGADQRNYVYLMPAGFAPVPNHSNTSQGGWYLPGDETYVQLGNADTRDIVAGFFNLDAHPDVACANFQGLNVIYYGRGDGYFNTDGTLPGVTNPAFFGDTTPNGQTQSIDAGEINGTIGIDVVVVESDEGGRFVPWFVDLGAPIAGAKRTGLGDVQVVRLYDLDNDGDLDAVIGVGSNGGIAIMRNNGTGLFTQVGGFLGSNSVYGLACADVNGDGALDIISGNTNNQNNTIWLCNSLAALTYQDSGLQFGGQNTHGIGVTNNGVGVDGYGVDDFVTAETSGGSKLYWTGR